MSYTMLLPLVTPFIIICAVALWKGTIRNSTYSLLTGTALVSSAAIHLNDGELSWLNTALPLLVGGYLLSVWVRRRPRPRPLDGTHEAIR